MKAVTFLLCLSDTLPKMTFIVRASIDFRGRLQGLILQVPTGRKERFEGAAQLGDLIAAMIAAQRDASCDLMRLEDGQAGENESEA